MAIKELLKKLPLFFSVEYEKKSEINFLKKLSFIIYPVTLIVILIIYSLTYNSINNKNRDNEKIQKFFNSKEFVNTKNSNFDILNSPYREFKYKIENNDSIGKILKKFRVSNNEVQKIIEGLKKKKLTNVYAGRELNIVLKELSDGTYSIISVLYPINNTLSVEIRKKKDIIEIKENILKLNKKEVVIENFINNNLYSAAMEAGIEPNIIIEFARIYGFEIDFQRDIRKGIFLKFIMKNLQMIIAL